MRRFLTYVVLFFVSITFVGLASAQTDSTEAEGPDQTMNRAARNAPDWGLTDSKVYTISARDLNGDDATSDGLREAWGAASTYCSDTCVLEAGINLPQGVAVTGLELDAFDNDPSKRIVCSLLRCLLQDDACSSKIVSTGTAFDGGNTLPSVAIDPPYTVDNSNIAYLFSCTLHGSSSGIRLRAIRIGYQLQISPAPGSATFWDVPVGSFGFKHVEALAASGITAGCGAGAFCPDNTLTRVEMAVFLAKALGLHWQH